MTGHSGGRSAVPVCVVRSGSAMHRPGLHEAPATVNNVPRGDRKMSAKRASGIVAAIWVATILAGCQQGPTVPTVHVGMIAELSGDLPAVGASSRNAAELAVREVNDAGGLQIGDGKYRIELAVEDNASKADQSAAAAQKLASDSAIVAIVGPNASLGAIPAAEIAESSRLVLITPWSTNPKTTLDARTGAPKKYVFRACFTDPFEGRVLAKFALDTLKAHKAAILYDQSSEAPKSQSE